MVEAVTTRLPYTSRDVTTLQKYYGCILPYCMDTATIVFTVLLVGPVALVRRVVKRNARF